MRRKLRQRLTNAVVAALTRPAGKSCHIEWDAELTGFGVLLQGSCRSWVVCWTRRRAGGTRRITLGRFPDLDAARARELATEVLGRLPPPARAPDHGYSGTPIYGVWREMRARCRYAGHPRFAGWGGRGISVDPRWHSFPQFLSDMGPRPKGTSLDRIDNDLGYFPANCRWATAAEQAANKRNRGNVEALHIAHGGGLDTVEWL
jgi:hypothetical protein